MATTNLVSTLNCLMDFMGYTQGETLYGIALRLRNWIDSVVSYFPEDSEAATEYVVAVETANDLFSEHERRSLPLPEVIRLIPGRIAEHSEA